ncbi:hypothetical protein DRQ36_07615 [bacterium]|nr:MAG: hypothetical protein DRQ36_07615 [bacterium]
MIKLYKDFAQSVTARPKQNESVEQKVIRLVKKSYGQLKAAKKPAGMTRFFIEQINNFDYSFLYAVTL